MRARQTLESRSIKTSEKKMDAAVSTGTAILSALFGKKKMSSSTISKSIKSTSKALKSDDSIIQAQESLEAVELQLENIKIELEEEISKIAEKYDMDNEKIEEIEIRTSSSNITNHYIGLAWYPN